MFCGIVPQGMERIMDEPVVLRTAKVGGFVKEDVLQYVDELNSKNFALEEQLKTLQEGNVADPQEVSRLRKQKQGICTLSFARSGEGENFSNTSH